MNKYQFSKISLVIIAAVVCLLLIQCVRMIEANSERVSSINGIVKRDMPDVGRYLDRWLDCYKASSSAKDLQQCDIAIQLASKATKQDDRVAVALERQRDMIVATNKRSNVGWPLTLIYEN